MMTERTKNLIFLIIMCVYMPITWYLPGEIYQVAISALLFVLAVINLLRNKRG